MNCCTFRNDPGPISLQNERQISWAISPNHLLFEPELPSASSEAPTHLLLLGSINHILKSFATQSVNKLPHVNPQHIIVSLIISNFRSRFIGQTTVKPAALRPNVCNYLLIKYIKHTIFIITFITSQIAQQTVYH